MFSGTMSERPSEQRSSRYVREAVGAEKQSVSGLDGEDGRVDLDLFFGAQSAGDQVLLRVLGGLGAR